MTLLINTLNDFRVSRAAREHARLRIEPAHDRMLEAVLGPTITVHEDDLDLKRQSRIAQRSREAIDDAETVVANPGNAEPPNPAKVPPYVYLLIALGCALADFAGSELTAYYSGIPARQRVLVAASFTAAALLVTTGAGTAIEYLWMRNVASRVAAVLICVVYVAALLLVASSRFAPIDGEEVSAIEIAGGALMALFVVGGPAVGVHLAFRGWLKARPAALAERAATRVRRKAERDLDRAHETLRDSQRNARARETERVRLRAVYLNAFREEAARLALVPTKSTTNPNPEEF